MRSNQTAAPESAVSYNSNAGINMLPGYAGEIGPEQIGNIYDPASLNYNPPPSFIPTAPAAPIPRAMPVGPPLGQMQSIRDNARSFSGPSSYPAPGTPSYTEPLEPRPGFFGRIFGSLGNLAGGVAGGIGGLASGIGSLAGGIGDMTGDMDDLSSGLSGFFGRMGRAAPRPAPSYNMAGFGNATPAQMAFPGLSIGPTSGRVTNPYAPVAGQGLGRQRPMGGPAPGYAQAFSNVVRARNIA